MLCLLSLPLWLSACALGGSGPEASARSSAAGAASSGAMSSGSTSIAQPTEHGAESDSAAPERARQVEPPRVHQPGEGHPEEPGPPATTPSSSPEEDTARGRAPGALAPRRGPDLFAREPAPAHRVLQHAVIRAFRARVADTIACYEPLLCRGEAEPARVGVRFEIAEDGRIERARVAEVTEYCRAPARHAHRAGALGAGAVEARPGDLDGELARCLLHLTESVRVDAPPALLPAPSSFVFRPERGSCPPSREAAAPCTQ